MKPAFLVLALAAITSAASAQTVVSDFSNFVPDEYSAGLDGGAWSADTASSGPDTFTIGDFGQGLPSGNAGNRFVSFLPGVQDWSSFTSVTLHGSVLPTNETPFLYLYLEDANFSSSTWNEFNLANFADGVETITLDFMGLDPTQITAWGFAVLDQQLPQFGFTFDQLTVVPEPATYAAMFAALALGVVVYRRRRG